mmetsp:Transcript_5100/g.8909  ORF Transcript_5100/g.8909 Transcript_5100/m.8909 type:complete len:99 (+) Transcript_5100:556-852(+)
MGTTRQSKDGTQVKADYAYCVSDTAYTKERDSIQEETRSHATIAEWCNAGAAPNRRDRAGLRGFNWLRIDFCKSDLIGAWVRIDWMKIAVVLMVTFDW